VEAVTITGTYFDYPLMDGQAELAWTSKVGPAQKRFSRLRQFLLIFTSINGIMTIISSFKIQS